MKSKLICLLILSTMSFSTLAQLPCTGQLIKRESGSKEVQSGQKLKFELNRNDEYYMGSKLHIPELNVVVAIEIINLTSTGRIISKERDQELISTTSGSLLSGFTHTIQNEDYFLKISCKK